MRINKINNIEFSKNRKKQNHKREIIDIIADNVKNPEDINDCVEVPRGIFKAYIFLMAGSSMGLISSALPKKWKLGKALGNISCAILSFLSAVYFAKPFAVKGLLPTVKKDINKS